jgi:hypothetical protein
MDAAQQMKGSTENAEDSDDPDSGSNRYSNEKRKGRFLIEEIEEENQIHNDIIDIKNIACDVLNNDLRSHSFNLKKNNLVINTIEYFGEIQNFSDDVKRPIVSFIFDNNTNVYVPTEKIFIKIKNSYLIYKYVDLFPHLYPEDCMECIAECDCFKTVEDNKNQVNYIDTIDNANIIDNNSHKDNINKNYIITVTNEESKKNTLELIEAKTVDILQTEKKNEKNLEKFHSEKHLLKRNDKNRLCLSNNYSNYLVTNEYALLSAHSRKKASSPQSCKIHSNNKKYKDLHKKFKSNEINFSFIKEEKIYVSPRLTPIRYRKSLDDKQMPFSAITKNPILSKNYLSAASLRNALSLRNSSIFQLKSFDYSFKNKYPVRTISKRHYSYDFPSNLKDKDNLVRVNEKLNKGPNQFFRIKQENIQILAEKNFSKYKTLKIEKSISLSFSKSEKVCKNCNGTSIPDFCN